MSGKTIAIVAGGLLASLLLLVVLLARTGEDATSASITIQSGQKSEGGLSSTLKCDGESASGSGLFQSREDAAKGCRTLRRVSNQLVEPQAACPSRSLSGPPVYRISGQVNGKKVDYQTFENTCSQRMNQFERITPLIVQMQSQIEPPKLQVMISPPPAPALTAADIAKTERLIKKLGFKGYQRYVEKTSKIPRKPSRNMKACPRPLPEYFSPCLITIQPRRGESQQQALKRVQRQNPQWFRNDGPDTPPLPPAKKP